MGQLGKMTSTVLTFCSTSARFHNAESQNQLTPSLDISIAADDESVRWASCCAQELVPFMNIITSEALNEPAPLLEIVSSVAPNACLTDSAATDA